MQHVQIIYDTPPEKMPVIKVVGLTLKNHERDELRKELDDRYGWFCQSQKGTYDLKTRISSLRSPVRLSFEAVPNEENTRDPRIILSLSPPSPTPKDTHRDYLEHEPIAEGPSDDFAKEWVKIVRATLKEFETPSSIGRAFDENTQLRLVLNEILDDATNDSLPCDPKIMTVIGAILIYMAGRQGDPDSEAPYRLAMRALTNENDRLSGLADYLNGIHRISHCSDDGKKGWRLFSRFIARAQPDA